MDLREFKIVTPTTFKPCPDTILSIIPARNESVPIWRTKGKYRKEMKRGYSKKMYHQRSKVETVFYVIKKSMGDDIRSIKTKAQNNEMRFKIIAYNAARIASLAYSLFVGFLQSLVSSMLKYIKDDIIDSYGGAHRKREASLSCKRDTCCQGPAKGMLDWWTWGPLEPCKSMKNGNDSKLPWMKEEPQPLITG